MPDPVAAGQESVWDYPRPPRLERWHGRVEIELGGELVGATEGAFRVLETSHPPTFYLPPGDFVSGVLRPAAGGSFCEWKGRARYFDLVAGGVVAARAAWSYPDPTPPFRAIRDFVSLYPAAVDACRVDGEIVRPQPGGFYGGWITDRVAGPFKGVPGSEWW